MSAAIIPLRVRYLAHTANAAAAATLRADRARSRRYARATLHYEASDACRLLHHLHPDLYPRGCREDLLAMEHRWRGNAWTALASGNVATARDAAASARRWMRLRRTPA